MVYVLFSGVVILIADPFAFGNFSSGFFSSILEDLEFDWSKLRFNMVTQEKNNKIMIIDSITPLFIALIPDPSNYYLIYY